MLQPYLIEDIEKGILGVQEMASLAFYCKLYTMPTQVLSIVSIWY